VGRHTEMDNSTEGGPNNWEQPWPCTETLRTLAELNEQCLELMREQALLRTSPAPSILRDLVDWWAKLDGPSLRRAAACPYLLIDAGFADPYRWGWVGGNCIGDREPIAYGTCFTALRATNVAQQVFSNAWYIVRTQPVGAPIFLGMPPHCASLLKACSMRQVTDLANKHVDWLRPRWAGRVRIWQELLEAALGGDALELEMARMHGTQLLAHELRALEQLSAKERPARLAGR
jgi:hypothetical protein